MDGQKDGRRNRWSHGRTIFVREERTNVDKDIKEVGLRKPPLPILIPLCCASTEGMERLLKGWFWRQTGWE